MKFKLLTMLGKKVIGKRLTSKSYFLNQNSSMSSRGASAMYMGGFIAPKLDNVRIAVIGVGYKKSCYARQLAHIEGVELVAIADLFRGKAKNVAIECMRIGKGERHKSIKLYIGKNEWLRMLIEVKPDAVVINTPWRLHAQMAIKSMKGGAHAFVEVPLGVTIEELWEIIDTSESTQKHCMMMGNTNYGREELLFLNMCRNGVIGELLHGEAAYIHELRKQMFHDQRGPGTWRTYHYANRNGNLYPTHGLGPVSQYMNLARGEDNFKLISSFSSPAKGRSLFANTNFSKCHRWNKLDFKGGDLNTSIIKTQLGRTIMVQWDETSPRPYTRHNLIQGTKGILAGYPTRVALENGFNGICDDHQKWIQGGALEAIYDKYEHPLYKRLGELGNKMEGHRGKNYVMLNRLIECLRNAEPLDQNIYEGCFWSAVGPLSEKSVEQDGLPQSFPDFTRGDWKHTLPLNIVS